MSDRTNISWADATWNPIIGCSRVSEGCRHCYAEKMAARLVGIGVQGYREVMGERGWNGKTTLVESRLEAPLLWRRPRRIFVCSMGDLFHESIAPAYLDQVFSVIARCPRHRFLVLTKRPLRMVEYILKQRTAIDGGPVDNIEHLAQGPELRDVELVWPMPHVWLGFSAENQLSYDQRAAAANELAGAGWNTWASLEPLLGPIDLRGELAPEWIVAGGESGPQARAMDETWVMNLRDDCQRLRRFYFKQWSGPDPGWPGLASVPQWFDSAGGTPMDMIPIVTALGAIVAARKVLERDGADLVIAGSVKAGSLRRLAKAVGCSPTYLSFIANRKERISRKLAAAIVRYIDGMEA